ncbi:inositol 3-kinase [Sarracenia purpurea var. burkii]
MGFSDGDGVSGLGGFFKNMDENDWRVGLLSSQVFWSFDAAALPEYLSLLPKMTLSLLNRRLGSPEGVVSSGCLMIFRTSSGFMVLVDIQALIQVFDSVDGTVKLVGLRESGFFHFLPRIGFLKALALKAPFMDVDEATVCCVDA